jgi:hypothetical protein
MIVGGPTISKSDTGRGTERSSCGRDLSAQRPARRHLNHAIIDSLGELNRGVWSSSSEKSGVT